MTEQRPAKVLICGAQGRLGREIVSLLSEQCLPTTLKLVGTLSRHDHLDDPSVRQRLQESDLVIDVSLPHATHDLLTCLSDLEQKPALVCGVTGLSETTMSLLHRYAQLRPTFYARNFSIGVALLSHLSALTTRVLGDTFDVELFELHHRQKVDAPSGTAYHLAETIARERDGYLSSEPLSTPRNPKLIHMNAGRGGQVIGEHTIYFLGESERIELTHRAQSRRLFAVGALRAASWLATHHQTQQIWGMEDMISKLLQMPRVTEGTRG